MHKASIAAKYNGLSLEQITVEMGKTNKTAEFLNKFPMGKVPAFESADGKTLFESNAIAYYGKTSSFQMWNVIDARFPLGKVSMKPKKKERKR